MAKVSTCDGCGKQSDELESLGWVIQKDYCSDCAEEVNKYLQEYDDLHDNTVAYFEKGKKKLKNSFKLNELPDG